MICRGGVAQWMKKLCCRAEVRSSQSSGALSQPMPDDAHLGKKRGRVHRHLSKPNPTSASENSTCEEGKVGIIYTVFQRLWRYILEDRKRAETLHADRVVRNDLTPSRSVSLTQRP